MAHRPGTPRTVMESFKVRRVGAAEVALHHDGLSLMDPKMELLDRLGLLDRRKAPAPDDHATTSQIAEFGIKMASTPGFLWMVSEGNGRATQIAAGRAYARVQLAATARVWRCSRCNRPCRRIRNSLRHTPPHAAIHRLLGAAQPAQTAQM